MQFEFTDNINEEIHEHITALFDRKDETAEQRSQNADDLIEAYMAAAGGGMSAEPRMADYSQAYVPKPKSSLPPSSALERLGSYIMREDYEDRRSNKVSETEYPTLSEDQTKRRNRREFPHPDLKYDPSDSVGKITKFVDDRDGIGSLTKVRIYPSSIPKTTQKPLY